MLRSLLNILEEQVTSIFQVKQSAKSENGMKQVRSRANHLLKAADST
jgi:hypothetical protein